MWSGNRYWIFVFFTATCELWKGKAPHIFTAGWTRWSTAYFSTRCGTSSIILEHHRSTHPASGFPVPSIWILPIVQTNGCTKTFMTKPQFPSTLMLVKRSWLLISSTRNIKWGVHVTRQQWESIWNQAISFFLTQPRARIGLRNQSRVLLYPTEFTLSSVDTKRWWHSTLPTRGLLQTTYPSKTPGKYLVYLRNYYIISITKNY